jgi:hypothetical protein
MSRVRRGYAAVVIALGGLIGLAACSSRGATHTSHATSSAAVGNNHESSKPPVRILADAAAALRNAHGYRMQGTIRQNGHVLRLSVAVPGPRSLEVTFSVAGANLDVIASPNASYVRGNATFWRSHLGARAAAVADRWVQIAPASAQALTSTLGHFGPATISRCLTEDHGTLSIVGTTTLGGRSAVIVKDKGDALGASRGELAVATTGPPYPLQATSNGGQRAGGAVDVCNDGKATDTRGTLTFSQFGAVPPLRAPKDAIRLGGTLNA